MAIDQELRNKIRRLFYAEHFTINAIAASLALHHETVRRAIEVEKFTRPKPRASMVAPFLPVIEETLATYPKMTATRLWLILKDRGFSGSAANLRRVVRPVRKKVKESFIKRDPLAGEEAQADWAHFGTVAVPGGRRKLHCFVMVMSFSRMLFARFTYELSTWSLLGCHLEAFQFFGMIPRAILYDNMKSVVTERAGAAIRFNRELLEFAGHYHFNPKVCHPYRGNEKGRVERSIRFIRESFFEGRAPTDIAALNGELDLWRDTVCNARAWPDNREKTVMEKFLDERPLMLPLPGGLLTPEDSRIVSSGKQPLISYDCNQYTIPPGAVGRPLNLRANAHEVRIYLDQELIARHERSFAKGHTIRDAAHWAEAIKHKKVMFAGSESSSSLRECDVVRRWLACLADRGEPLERSLRGLSELDERYGRELLLTVLADALGAGLVQLPSLERELLLEAERQGISPKPLLRLPERALVKELAIRSHDLGQYDNL